MTIWSGRTQRGIASGFAAASVSGNRILHSMVLDARRVPYSVTVPTGAVALHPLKAPSGNHALWAISRNSA